MGGGPPHRTRTNRIHGDDLIAEVLRNMEEGLFHIREKTLVPAIYRIYLNPDDYEPFRNVAAFVAGEIRASLDTRLADWNGTQRKFALPACRASKLAAGDAAASTGEYVRLERGVDSRYISPISTANSSAARLRFIQNSARRRRPNMAPDR